MSPFSTALHHLSRFWGSLSRHFRKVKTARDAATPPSPVPQSPQKILPVEEPRYDANFFNADDQAHSFPSSFSFSDPLPSFGLPWRPCTSLLPDLNSVPLETEENPSTVSYEEVLVTGQKRIAVYEEWRSVTDVSMI
jgi:hypothetical protein